MAKLSVQMYSVKDASEKDFFKSIEDIAKMGYDGVEFASFYGAKAEDVKEKLDSLNLEVSGAHVGIGEMRDNIDGLIEFHKTIGNKDLIIPYATVGSKEEAESLNAEFEVFSKKLRENGMRLSYHNHAHEMVEFDGKYAYDIMMGDNEDILYEVDTFWTEYAGVDTVEYLKKIGTRCPLVHLKDMAADRKESTVYGEGVLDNKKILKAALDYCKPEWLVIEWEAFGSMDCMEAVKRSLANLKKNVAEM